MSFIRIFQLNVNKANKLNISITLRKNFYQPSEYQRIEKKWIGILYMDS
jgi:hypothetical protein